MKKVFLIFGSVIIFAFTTFNFIESKNNKALNTRLSLLISNAVANGESGGGGCYDSYFSAQSYPIDDCNSNVVALYSCEELGGLTYCTTGNVVINYNECTNVTTVIYDNTQELGPCYQT